MAGNGRHDDESAEFIAIRHDLPFEQVICGQSAKRRILKNFSALGSLALQLPPLTPKNVPVMKEAWALASHKIARATASG
jgi:hypothetical protein